MLAALLNGTPADTLAISDRGLHYGDGLFETIAFRSGKVLNWAGHMARLQHGCERIQLPPVDSEQLKGEVYEVASKHECAVVKVIYTRGSGGRGYRLPAPVLPTRLVIAYNWPKYPTDWAEQGVRLYQCHTPCAQSPALAGLKHLNRLEHVLARAEWESADIAEGVMCDVEGYVVEGTMSNLFWFKNGEIFTPELNRAGVAGTTRALLLEIAAEQGLKVHEGRYRIEELLRADELMLSNAVIGVWPVRECEGHIYGVEQVRQLQSALETKRLGGQS